MKNQVTVIIDDKLIIVDGRALNVNFTIPQNAHEGLRAIQWHNEKGNAECVQDGLAHNHLFGADKYDEYVKPFVDLWEAQKIVEDIPTPEPTPEAIAEKIKQNRINEINQELNAIDLKSIRPERSLRVGRGTDFDTQRLLELEIQANALRAELAGLS